MNNPIKKWLTEETVMNLALVKGMVVLGESEKFKKEWGGAGIIVTSDKDDKRKADIKIITKHAKHISFLLYQLKDIFKKYIDYSNKREFYAYVVNLIDREELEKEDDSKKVLITMIDKLIGLEKKN
jgi:uncharacterized alkaline shock family protein YloU